MNRLVPALLVAGLILFGQAASAQELSLDMGGGSVTATSLQLIALITLLSLAPGIAMMVTCFPFMVTVLAILRQAIGLQQSPPNMLIVSLALFLTYFVMEPVFMTAYQNGVQPLLEEQIDVQEALTRGIEPFRGFMAARTDPDTFSAMADLRPDARGTALTPEANLSVPVPFMLSEISRAFQIGFLIFCRFSSSIWWSRPC